MGTKSKQAFNKWAEECRVARKHGKKLPPSPFPIHVSDRRYAYTKADFGMPEDGAFVVPTHRMRHKA